MNEMIIRSVKKREVALVAAAVLSKESMRMTRSRLVGVVIMLLAAVSAIAVPTAPAAAASGTRALQLAHLWNLKSGLCMGVEGGRTSNGSRVLQWNCNGAPDQLWNVDFSGSDRQVVNYLRSPSNQYACLGVSGGSTAQGAQLVVWQCDGSRNQKWSAQGSSACGGHILVNQGSGQLISVEGGSTSNGAPVIQWPHGSTPDQTWCHE
jgi:hypothetical protein